MNKRKKSSISPILIFAIVLFVGSIVFAIVHDPNPYKLKASESPLKISEYMISNEHYYLNKGKAEPWVEIYNPTDETLSLRGFKLKAAGKSFKLGNAKVEGKSYYLAFMDSNMKFENKPVYLVDKKGRLVSIFAPGESEANISYVLDTKDNASFKKSSIVTPGFANSKKGLKAYQNSRRKLSDDGVVINEVMSSNSNAFFDAFGYASDYVELFNNSKKSVDISNYGLSDNENNLFKFVFPSKTVIKSGECALIICNKKHKDVESGDEKNVFYAPFSLKNASDGLYLSNEDAFIVNEMDNMYSSKDAALIRYSNGSFAQSYNISPNFPNTSEGINSFLETQIIENRGGVYISEASSKNTQYALLGENAYDWVELCNPSGAEINLTGYGLSDERGGEPKYIFKNQKIKSGENLLVYCSKKNLEGSLNTGFALNGSSGIYLYDTKGNLIDGTMLTELPLNVSKGRESDSMIWKYFNDPTPGKANGKGKTKIANSVSSSVASGKYNVDDALNVELSSEGTIYYTTDGTIPNKNAKKYDKPFSLSKTSVISAISYEDDAIASPVASFSYIINENHSLDVVSVITDPDGFFSNSSGIYATGNNASSTFPYFGANFWQGWKRQATLQLLSDDEAGFSIVGDASIFGGYSKAYAKKSIKFKFRDIYGSSKLKYPLFKNRDFDEYDSIVLRAGGQDVSKSMIRDDLITSLADSVVDVMATRPAVMYINGEYWGIYHIREKINDEYVASRLNVSPESVDIVQGNSIAAAGSTDEWKELLAYVKSHDLRNEENYKYVTDRIDVQNYADYIIAELYCANSDAGNIRCYKSDEADNKWRWIFYDVDMGFFSGSYGSLFEYLNPAGNGADNMFTTALINGLLKNSNFRKLFLDRLEYQMKNVWNKKRVLKAIDNYVDLIGSEVPRNHARWELTSSWEAYIEEIKSFVENRQSEMKREFQNSQSLKNVLNLTDAELERCFEKD